jgi:hypothetical protein
VSETANAFIDPYIVQYECGVGKRKGPRRGGTPLYVDANCTDHIYRTESKIYVRLESLRSPSCSTYPIAKEAGNPIRGIFIRDRSVIL